MPLLRYFLFTSAMLLGLLFLSDRYLQAPLPTAAALNDVDRSTIRIHSRHKWPEAIRMDTSDPMIIAAQAPAAVTATAMAANASTPALEGSPAVESPPAVVSQTAAPQPTAQQPVERTSRHAKPTRQARRESRRRFALRGQRLASYRAPEWQSWPLGSW